MLKRIIKTQSKQTYKNSKGKEVHYYNYWLEFENGKRIQIKVAFKNDLNALDLISEYEGQR